MTGKPIPLRLEDELISRVDRVKVVLERRAGGVEVPRASVIRLALERGLAVLEQEFPPERSPVVRGKRT
jgi:hypothetical protein